MPQAFLLTYLTAAFSESHRTSLVAALNEPNRKYDPADVVRVEDSGSTGIDLISKSTSEVIDIHREIAGRMGFDLEREAYGGLFVILNQRTLEEYESKAEEGKVTVEVVYVAESKTGGRSVRSDIELAVGIWTSLDAGNCGWETFEGEAERGGGVLLGGPDAVAAPITDEASGVTDNDVQGDGGNAASGGRIVKMRARTSTRPAESVV